jgi:phosphate transport system protein
VDRVSDLASADRVTDEVTEMVEAELQVCLARQAPVASDLRFVLTALRVVPQLERSLDLVVHIAERAAVGALMAAETRSSFARAGTVTEAMWDATLAAWDARDPDAVTAIDARDDELDLLIGELPGVVSRAATDPVVGMAAVLIGRFYERLGDHAVHVARRIRWLATGTRDG